MLDAEDVVSRIPEGVALLDDVVPDWASKVDLATLSMSDYNTCVLGQVFGDYSEGRARLGIPLGDGKWYGFDQVGVDPDWDLLDDAWRAIISERRSA